MTIDVYLDSAPETFVPELALHAERLIEDRRNGWLRPLATAEAFGDFLDRWRRNEPNGTWGYGVEVDDYLLYLDSPAADEDDESDIFPRAGQTADGTALYDLTGWAWTFGE